MKVVGARSILLRRSKPATLFILVLFFSLQILTLTTVQAEPGQLSGPALANAVNSFTNLWSRNDQPVAAGAAVRSWTWGPHSFQIGSEPYAESPGGKRIVAYYDKTRMEINNPGGNPSDPWYITNGLLVKEMVSGKVQIGDNSYQSLTPAAVPVAGDPADSNPTAPTYASFSQLADKRASASAPKLVTATIDKNGKVGNSPTFAQYAVNQSYYETTLGHHIPDVFLNFFNSQGLIYKNGGYTTDSVFDWVFTAGLPLTEPYWITTKVGGKDMSVLVQLFERRVLTYNPANPPEWRVEMGNVGQHFYSWRYGNTPQPVPARLGDNFARISEANDGSTVIEVGNSTVKTSSVFGKNGGAYTSSFSNLLTGQEYLGQPSTEFRLTLSHELAGDDNTQELNSWNFQATAFDIITNSPVESTIRVKMQGSFEGSPVNLSLYYQSLPDQNFVRKWLKVDPFTAPGWVYKRVILQEWTPTGNLQPVIPAQRYLESFAKTEPNYGESVRNDAVITSDPTTRFEVADASSSVALHNNNKEGFYFFVESLFGEERFSQSEGLSLGNTDFVEPSSPFISGRSILGVWQGAPEIGFKRFNDYLYNFYSVVKGKKESVWFSTWYPFEGEINQAVLLDTVDRMQSAGFYDTLHIDAGWQVGAPLQVNPDRFPNGLDPIINKLKANGKTVGFWMNPFSRSYENLEGYSEFAAQHPEWVDQNDPKQRFCPLTGAGDYVRSRLLDLARTWPLEEIYWDGADWNISNCQSTEKRWRTPDEESHQMIKFYASILQELHTIRPDLKVVVWSAPANPHWLSVADQVQLSDIDTPPVLTSELIRRQQIYYANYTMPNNAIWGDWYGLNYRRTWQDGLGLPIEIQKFATISVIANGATQAGGSLDLSKTSPELISFLQDLFAWRKSFIQYFDTYQHVLGFPDGQNVDGEGHIINGRGFILLFNPTSTATQIDVPLAEPSLELTPGTYYNLSNWNDLKQGFSMGQARPNDKVTVTIPGYGYQIIGLNM